MNTASPGCLVPHTRYDDDQKQDNDACNQAHTHLHVLPPHLLPHSVGAAAEAMGLVGQVVGLGLQMVQVLTALPDLLDVIVHDINGVVDFLKKRLVRQSLGTNKTQACTDQR